MPRLAGLGLDHYAVAVIANDTNATTGHAQHQCRDVRRQQQIAAAADHQQWHIMGARVSQCFAHIGVAVGFGEQLRTNVHTKGVERFQGNLRVYLQTHNRPFTSISNRSQARSIRSSTCSKP